MGQRVTEPTLRFSHGKLLAFAKDVTFCFLPFSRFACSYLEEASRTPNSLHVVYINTSLVTKVSSGHPLPPSRGLVGVRGGRLPLCSPGTPPASVPIAQVPPSSLPLLPA